MKNKRVPVEVQTWTKKWLSAYDGPTVAKLEVFPHANGARLTSSVKFTKPPKNAGPAPKPDVWNESGEKLQGRLSRLPREGWSVTTKTVRVRSDEAPRGRTEAEVARAQYDEELRALLRR